MDLERYLAAWQLSAPQPLATTATSHVYRVQTTEGYPAVLKLLTPVGVHDERAGATALAHFGGRGAVRLLRHDDSAQLLDEADGPDLVAMVRRGADDRAARIIAQVLNKLHSAPADDPPAGLWTLRRRFQALFARAQQDDDDTLFTRGARVAEMLLRDARQVRVLHGDMHHENVLYSSARGWLALDPKGILGERTFDAANVLCNPPGMAALVEDEARLLRISRVLAAAMHLEYGRLLAFVYAYACLSACWSLEDGDDPGRAWRIAHLAERHVLASPMHSGQQ